MVSIIYNENDIVVRLFLLRWLENLPFSIFTIIPLVNNFIQTIDGRFIFVSSVLDVGFGFLSFTRLTGLPKNNHWSCRSRRLEKRDDEGIRVRAAIARTKSHIDQNDS